MTDEEFVRAHWEWVRVRFAEPYLPPFSQWGFGFGTEAEAWAVAAEFTRDRLEEIRCLESDMIRVRGQMDKSANDSCKCIFGERGLEGGFAACSYGWARILYRLESALAKLKRGTNYE